MESKAKIKNKMYDVCTLRQFIDNPNQYLPKYTAIQQGGYLYPVLTSTQVGAGVHVNPKSITFFNRPKEDIDEYRKDNAINFNEVDNIASMIDKLDAVKKIENEVLSSVDNIFVVKHKASDTPEMAALKTAVNKKQIDWECYEHRFGANSNNDKRLFNKTSISLGMIKRVATALDMEVTLTIKDAPEAPNPIGELIEVKLTGNDNINDDIET